MLMLDSGAVTALAARSSANAAIIRSLLAEGLWPPVVASVVVAESTTGRAGPDATTNRFLKMCGVDEIVSEATARRAGHLRFRARQGSAVDALVVALAEPDGCVITGDPDDLSALAQYAEGVSVRRI
jgi:hypothetical protein